MINGIILQEKCPQRNVSHVSFLKQMLEIRILQQCTKQMQVPGDKNEQDKGMDEAQAKWESLGTLTAYKSSGTLSASSAASVPNPISLTFCPPKRSDSRSWSCNKIVLDGGFGFMSHIKSWWAPHRAGIPAKACMDPCNSGIAVNFILWMACLSANAGIVKSRESLLCAWLKCLMHTREAGSSQHICYQNRLCACE